jgi:hypothetical protein
LDDGLLGGTMIARAIGALLVSFAVMGPGPALADDTQVQPAHTVFTVSGLHELDGAASPGSNDASSPAPAITSSTSLHCSMGGLETCDEPTLCDDGSIMTLTTYMAEGEVIDSGTNCPVDATPVSPPTVTPGLVLTALRHIGLPESDLMIQPPNARTLVNFDTNFYTDNGEFTRTVTLLGRRVELRIWPARYGWRFGDGATRWTTTPGAAYPDLEITHRYLRKGRVSPSVDTTYAAQFRVDGGPWREVNGTVTIPWTPQGLRVVTARPVLVGG